MQISPDIIPAKMSSKMIDTLKRVIFLSMNDIGKGFAISKIRNNIKFNTIRVKDIKLNTPPSKRGSA